MKDLEFENALERIVDKRNERIIVLEGRIAKRDTVIGWLLVCILALIGGIVGAAAWLWMLHGWRYL